MKITKRLSSNQIFGMTATAAAENPSKAAVAVFQPEPFKTQQVFRVHNLLWRALGFIPTKNYRNLYILYAIVLNVTVTIFYPIHLLVGLFNSTTMLDILKNLSINLTSVVCSIKTFAIWIKFQNVEKIFTLIKKQEQRIQSDDERQYYANVTLISARNIQYLFNSLCSAIFVSNELAVLAGGLAVKWDLMYPAYFPFDVFGNRGHYAVAHIYQFFGISIQIAQNVVNDTFTGMHLAVLSGQVHVLGMRVAKIGYDPKKSKQQNNEELLDCVRDHWDIMKYRDILQDQVSVYMFFQIVAAAGIMCITIVYMLLFVRDPFAFLYNFLYLISMAGEIFPSCYYGTLLEIEFQNLSNSLFSCNWMEQDEVFKKNLRIFAEQTKKPMNVMAWLFRINMNAFLLTCKNAYSLFAVIMKMK